MKKLLITISPLCVILFTAMCFTLSLKDALVLFGATLFIVVMAFGFVKWVDFVDRHVKD